jgi:DNA repair protein RadC
MSRIQDLVEDSRPREKAIKNGIFSLSDSELVALIISSGIRGNSSLDIANNLLKKNDNIVDLSKSSYDNLNEEKGLSTAKVLTLLASFEISKRIISDICKNFKTKEYCPVKISIEFSFKYLKTREEKLTILAYKNEKRIQEFSFVSNNENNIYFSYKELIEKLVKIGTNKIILIHNHLGDDISPSNNDVYSTYELNKNLDKTGIKLIDHIIISQFSYFSFYENKILQ